MNVAIQCLKKMVISRALATFLAAVTLATAADAAGEKPRVTLITGDEDGREPLHTVVPEYPRLARRDRVEGQVQVCFNVDRNGRTYRLAVRTSSNRVFEKPAIKAVRQSSYRPLADADRLPAIKTCRTFRFSLEPVVIEDPVLLIPDSD